MSNKRTRHFFGKDVERKHYTKRSKLENDPVLLFFLEADKRPMDLPLKGRDSGPRHPHPLGKESNSKIPTLLIEFDSDLTSFSVIVKRLQSENKGIPQCE